VRSDEMTGSLAPALDNTVSAPPLCWPDDIDEKTKAAILADADTMRFLANKPPMEQLRQILLWQPRVPRVSPTERYRREAEREAAREKRDAELAPFRDPAQLCRLIQSLEAKIIEQGVRIATLEAAQPVKPGRVSRIPRSSTGPEEAA
jgi:hypothetical protein